MSWIYIDDQYGDSATGEMPIYNPVTGWTQGATCTGCAFHPETELAFNGTWHDTTHHTNDVPRTVQFNFTGIFSYLQMAYDQLSGIFQELLWMSTA